MMYENMSKKPPDKQTTKEVVGRINSTVLPSSHMRGVPDDTFIVDRRTVKMEDIELWMIERKQLFAERKALLREIHRLREALIVLSNVALANIELSKEKLEGE